MVLLMEWKWIVCQFWLSNLQHSKNPEIWPKKIHEMPNAKNNALSQKHIELTFVTGQLNIICPYFSKLPSKTFKNGSRSGFLKNSHRLIRPVLIIAWYSNCDARLDIILFIWNGETCAIFGLSPCKQ